jgi:glycosidase
LLLDFVPNHTALDHSWTSRHPEYYVQGTDKNLAAEPQNYWVRKKAKKSIVFAHGRDPYFPGWPDTLQLNYRHGGLRSAMMRELVKIGRQCDGVRCDMAMLLLPDVFQRTWGDASVPVDGSAPVDKSFWPEAIAAVRARNPNFLFMAEVYWDLEWTLQQQGFDYTYDKRLYDRLLSSDAHGVRGHLGAELGFQRKLVRFLENHDEPRIAARLPEAMHKAAALITYFVPGLRFFHEGQLDGRRVKASVHLCRRPHEQTDPAIGEFYRKVLACLKRTEAREGAWQLLQCKAAWQGNPTSENFICLAWESANRSRLIVTVNYGATQGQCLVGMPFPDIQGQKFVLRDLLGSASHEWNGNDLIRNGLFLDVPAWGCHAFEVLRRD